MQRGSGSPSQLKRRCGGNSEKIAVEVAHTEVIDVVGSLHTDTTTAGTITTR